MKALRAILGVAFIVAVVYGTWIMVPPYYSNYQLQDTIASLPGAMWSVLCGATLRARCLCWRPAAAI